MNEEIQYTGQGLTEQFEGCKLTAYQDVNSVWTIGYGHTLGVSKGMSCTSQQAEDWLVEDLQWAVSTVRKTVTVVLTQDEFNALVDFVFNEGIGNFVRSTLLVDLNAGDFAAAADQFQRWCDAGGEIVAGLLRRRIAEENEFKGEQS